MPVPPNTDQVVWVFLSELEGNILIRPELDLCLGQTHLSSDSANKDELCYTEFKHSSFHRINQIPLNKLSIRIANHESININSVANRVTSVTLEIMDEIETGEQFEVAGFSNLPAENNPFPYNRVNDFTISLPYEINLGAGWEVALKSITFPAALVHSEYWLSVQNEKAYIDVSAIKTRRQALGVVVDTLKRSEYSDDMYVQTLQSNNSRNYVLRVTRLRNTNYPDGFSLGYSEKLAKLLNPEGDIPDLNVMLEEGQYFPLTVVAADLDRPLAPNYSPIGFIHCDVVASSVVGGELQPLLHTIPMGQFVFSNNVSFYQPENILYRDTISRKFSCINIRVVDVKGNKYPFHAQNRDDSIIVTLKFRRRQNLASYAM